MEPTIVYSPFPMPSPQAITSFAEAKIMPEIVTMLGFVAGFAILAYLMRRWSGGQ